MLTHDALNAYVTDRQQSRERAATAARTVRLLRRARALVGTGPTGSADGVAPVPALAASSPAAGPATGPATGDHGAPAVVDLRTTTTAGAPQVGRGPAAA